MRFTDLDWSILDRLRAGFLDGAPSAAAYWQSPADLAQYDMSFGERIGWKWDALLRDLARSGFTLPPGPVLDWGCGSGIAGRRVAVALGAQELRLFDHSPLAVAFALRRAREDLPSVDTAAAGAALVGESAPGSAPVSDAGPPLGTLVVSHVLLELDVAARDRLVALAARAQAVLWVEPGTPAASRALGAVRAALLDTFEPVAPCPHSGPCGLLAAERSGDRVQDWCHLFAGPPAGVLENGEWVRFARRAGIDLRRLPYSPLALRRRGPPPSAGAPAQPRPSDGTVRLRPIGAPRVEKGFARLLSCEADGVHERRVRRRDSAAWLRRLGDPRELPILSARLEADHLLDLAEVPSSPRTGERAAQEAAGLDGETAREVASPAQLPRSER